MIGKEKKKKSKIILAKQKYKKLLSQLKTWSLFLGESGWWEKNIRGLWKDSMVVSKLKKSLSHFQTPYMVT